MVLEETYRLLFVGFRKPEKLIVFDADSDKVVADLDIAGDFTDIFYDALHKRIYISCGEGFVNVF
jgi:hypothetical protein